MAIDTRPDRRVGLRLSEELENKLVEGVENGVPMETAARAIGIGMSTIYEWQRVADGSQTWQDGSPVSDVARERCLSLSDRLSRALASYEARCVAAIDAAIGVVGASGVPEWRPALELLKHHPVYGKQWRQHRETTTVHVGSVSLVHKAAQQATRDEIADALPGEYREFMAPADEPGDQTR